MSQNTNLSLHANNTKKLRYSNLELFRIIVMILIIASHYVANSGITIDMANDPTSLKSIFLLLFGMWGKFGINCYLLITGYFMCMSQITLTKFIKLWFEVIFYGLLIYMIFVIHGDTIFAWKNLFYILIPINDISLNYFTGCFLLFYLFIPYLNILIKGMNKHAHGYLILLCLCIYTFLSIFFVIEINYVIWFSIIYIIASYIRKYQIPYYNNTVFWGCATLISIFISFISILFCLYFNLYPYKFVVDSNSIMAVVMSLCSFMFFKNINIPYNKWINIVGASTFGVLLIHANSDAMRQWLWVDKLHNREMYYSNHLIVHAVLSVLSIFIICSLLDQIRLFGIEKPLFKKIDPILTKISIFFSNKC